MFEGFKNRSREVSADHSEEKGGKIPDSKPVFDTEALGEKQKDFSYHQTKEIIEQERLRYQEEKGEEFPPISFTRERGSSKIKIDFTDIELFPLLLALLKKTGEVKMRTFLNDLNLNCESGMDIRIDPPFYSRPGSVEFRKEKDLLPEEIESVIETYKLLNEPHEKKVQSPEMVLESLGATIFNPKEAPEWDYIAGYEDVKKQVRETIILSLKHPEIYEEIAKNTRKFYQSNKPRAVLFEGPPGTGKTTMARIIAKEVDVPLVYVPIESIMSKWYSESSSNLGKIFQACKTLGSVILFLDEIDSLATTREKDIHEETRRILSVLLRNIEGFSENKDTILIGATNRKCDLDLALLSRFDTSIQFPLPNEDERKGIFENYATHLTNDELQELAKKTEGQSGRDIRNTCERAERSFASEVILNNETVSGGPSLEKYISFLPKDN